MDYTTTELNALITDMDALARALGVEDCTPELQLQITGAWSELLFKRLLLRIPDAQTAAVQSIITREPIEGAELDSLLDPILSLIPDADTVLREEITRAIGEFRTPRPTA